MKRYRQCAPFLLPLVCVAAVLSIGAQKKESGNDPYTPTKLEWMKVAFMALEGGFVDYPTLEITVLLHPPNNMDIVGLISAEEHRDYAKRILGWKRKVADSLAKVYGFDSWLGIRELVVLNDGKTVPQVPK